MEVGRQAPVRLSLLLGAVLVLQLMWVLAVPPFRAIDEFDHAYRAASVARGEWIAGEPAEDGRGDLVTVPGSLVDAAGPVCNWYPYTYRDNCTAVSEVGDGLVTVASASARYNPVFYWVVGLPTYVAEGPWFLYGTRIVATLLCSALMLAALALLRRSSASAWLVPGVLACMTPSLVYMTTVGAPNGVETSAAMLVFAALLVPGLRADARTERLALWGFAVGAVVLSSVRTLGPLWLVLLVATSLLVVGVRPWLAFVARRRTACLAVAGAAGLACLGNVVWTLSQRTNAFNQERDGHVFHHPWSGSLARIPLWFFQSIAAAPTRDEPAPTLVYALGAVMSIGWLVLALRRGGRRWWLVVGALSLAWVAVQLLFSVLGYRTLGAYWQGRYALPFLITLPLVAAYVAARSGARPPGRLTWSLGAVMLVGMNLVHAVAIADGESHRSYLRADTVWLKPPHWGFVLLAVGAVLLIAAAVRGTFPAPPARVSVPVDGSVRDREGVEP